MKTLYESILTKANVGLEAKIRKWLKEYTTLNPWEWELDKKGFINIPETSLVFIEGSEKLKELPSYIKFGEVGGGVYSIPRCHWRSFEGFPKKIGAFTRDGIGRGRFIMSTYSTVIDYMPEIIKKDPHAKYPIELRLENELAACKVDLPKDTMIYLPPVLEKNVQDVLDKLMPHAKENVHVSFFVSGTPAGALKSETKVFTINRGGVR